MTTDPVLAHEHVEKLGLEHDQHEHNIKHEEEEEEEGEDDHCDHDLASSNQHPSSQQPSTPGAPPNGSWNLIKNPHNGRTRISQACDRCRARKIKCSGKSENNPKCTNCEKDGFPCTVSDKLTRNSFPKGYTKNLEKKLLDVELSRNHLLLEMNTLKQRLAQLEKGADPKSLPAAPATKPQNDEQQQSQQYIPSQHSGTTPVFNINKENLLLELQNDYIQSARLKSYYMKPVKTNKYGLLILDQNLKSPFETIFASLKKNPFKGYKSSAFSGASNTATSNASASANDDLDPVALKHLTNYHMNLNRYLNLILYKLIFPLFNINQNNSDSHKHLDHLIWLFFNDYNKLIPIFDFELFYNDYLNFVNTYTIKNSTYSDNGELKKRYYEFNSKDQDILIKLILILKFTLCQPKINNSNKSSAFLPDKHALNQLDESIKLINLKHLTMMFKNINFCLSPNLDKLEISLLLFYYLIKFENYNLPNYTDSLHSHKEFLMNVIDLNKHLINTLNIDKPSNLLVTDKFPEKQLIEIQRLKLYWNFKILLKLSEIYFNIPLSDDEYNLNINQDPTQKDDKDVDKMDEDAPEEDDDDADESFISPKSFIKPIPQSLETIILVNNDIKITLCLVKLVNLIPWNIMQFVNDDNKEVLNRIDEDLSDWKKSVENLYNEENCVVFNKLQSYYLYFKVLVNINGNINSSYFIDFITLVYDLTFNNPKSNRKNSDEISIEASESLCLHSFNFHLVTLISITSLQNLKDKQTCQKIYKLIQLYQILINYKDVDPLITTFVTYIKENILFSFSDANSIQDDTLKLFSSVDMEKVNSTSLFDKKVGHRNVRNSISSASSISTSTSNTNTIANPDPNQMNFDLNAFNLPGDSVYSNDEQHQSVAKRRKSNASTTSSHLSSNMSLTSRESSVISSSRRLSVSSNDSMPSLFPSATSPFHNSSSNNNNSLFNNSNSTQTNDNSITPSAKKRIMDYAIQPLRTTMNRSRSLSADSRIRSSKISDGRRLSGNSVTFNHASRENSVEVQTKNANDDILITDDDIVSRILTSDVESEIDSDVSMILNNNTNTNNNSSSKSSKFKRCANILPTIPSEGNLMKIMGAMDPSAFEKLSPSLENAAKDMDFDVGSLFSIGPGMSSVSTTDNAGLSPDSNSLKAKMNDFSRAFKKSNVGSNTISSAFLQNSKNLKTSTSTSTTVENITSSTTPTSSTNLQNFTTISNDQSMIDDDDLMRLKEHVMSMKTSIH